MKISFVVIALNAAATLDSLFDCLGKQTYPHHLTEVILVDGLSKDDCFSGKQSEDFCSPQSAGPSLNYASVQLEHSIESGHGGYGISHGCTYPLPGGFYIE